MTPYLLAATATMPEVKAFVNRYPFAILPIGSTEQHGPHLPLDTDNRIAERVAWETATKSLGLVLPTAPFGYAWVWKGVPGCLTLSFDTYKAMIHDLAESLDLWGIKAVYVMSGHGANSQVVKHAVRELIHDRFGIKVLYGMYQGIDEMLAETDSERWHNDIHAEEIETSMMLAIAPETVRMDLAAADYPPVPADYGKSELSMGHMMRSGVFGDPTPATAEKGRRWIELAGARSAALWLSFLARHGLHQNSGAQ